MHRRRQKSIYAFRGERIIVQKMNFHRMGAEPKGFALFLHDRSRMWYDNVGMQIRY